MLFAAEARIGRSFGCRLRCPPLTLERSILPIHRRLVYPVLTYELLPIRLAV
jgi:hypothetical protein